LSGSRGVVRQWSAHYGQPVQSGHHHHAPGRGNQHRRRPCATTPSGPADLYTRGSTPRGMAWVIANAAKKKLRGTTSLLSVMNVTWNEPVFTFEMFG
jgi:hypothetical protein